MTDKSDLLAELVAADATIKEQAKAIAQLKREVAKLRKSTDKKQEKPIPSLWTPRLLAEQSGKSLWKILNVIHLHSIIPAAFADEIPLFVQEDADRIFALARSQRQKRKPPAVEGES